MLAAAMAAAATGAASTASTRAQNHAQNQQIMEQVEQIEKAAEQRGLQRAEEKLRQRRKEGGEGESSQSESGERSKLPANGAKKPRKSKKSSKHADKQRPQRPELNTMRGQSDFSAESFFATQQEPPTLAKTRKLAQDFVEMHNKAGRHVVLVTSGGTTVPLEQNVVRFLDNFSAGTRGATSAEYFLSAGYAVIFMHRQHSLSPYTRHYSHTTNPFLDLLAESSESSGSNICVKKEHAAALNPILRNYHDAHNAGTLLRLNFVTVSDYLFMLREMSHVMQSLGRRGMYYLAAAVSDFYVPSQKTPQHKIQSGKGSLVIEMDQVPKVLKPMVQEWAPEGYVVSFKLETDENLLIPKARGALERYGHQVVIGNDLQRRKYEVVFVERLSTGEFRESWLRLHEGADKETGESAAQTNSPTGEREIEEDIVRNLSKRHQQWIDSEERTDDTKKTTAPRSSSSSKPQRRRRSSKAPAGSRSSEAPAGVSASTREETEVLDRVGQLSIADDINSEGKEVPKAKTSDSRSSSKKHGRRSKTPSKSRGDKMESSDKAEIKHERTSSP